MSRAAPVGLLLLLTGLFGGCGAERAAVPDLDRYVTPGEFVKRSLADGDVRIDTPSEWITTAGSPPGVLTVATGRASLSVWAYRSVAEVGNRKQADAAGARLEKSLLRREPGFVVDATRTTTIGGAPAVELFGTGEVGARTVRFRSVHLYVGLTEYVIDALADPAVFQQANREAFAEIIDSVRVGGRAGTFSGQEGGTVADRA